MLSFIEDKNVPNQAFLKSTDFENIRVLTTLFSKRIVLKISEQQRGEISNFWVA